MLPRGGQNAEGFGSSQEFPPLSVQISYRNLCRMSCRKGLETPLAAGLARLIKSLFKRQSREGRPHRTIFPERVLGAVLGSFWAVLGPSWAVLGLC